MPSTTTALSAKGQVNVSSRVPWLAAFPPVFVHAAWADDREALPDHADYWRAKKKRDAEAALRVCDHFCRDEVLDDLHDLAVMGDELPPIVAVPAMTPHESQNYLAIGYGRRLAHELRWDIDRAIFQAKTLTKDFTESGWFRLANDPAFYGDVQQGRRYVIADDVCTMGGTLAALRGFIESQGGKVIGATVLASHDGRHVAISLAEGTRDRLIMRFGNGLCSACREELGYAVECLTEPEGRFLLRCSSVDAFRAGLHGARNG